MFVRLGDLKTYKVQIHRPFSSLHCLPQQGDFRLSQSHLANGLVALRNEWIFGDQMHLLLYFLSSHSWIVCAWAQYHVSTCTSGQILNDRLYVLDGCTLCPWLFSTSLCKSWQADTLGLMHSGGYGCVNRIESNGRIRAWRTSLKHW